MSIRLEDCPFCGCRYPRIEREGVCDFYYYVKCSICGARTTSECTEDAAADRWNRRA